MSVDFIMCDIHFILYIIKILFIGIGTYYTTFRITNNKNKFNLVIHIMILVCISITCGIIKYRVDSFWAVITLTILLGISYAIITHKGIIYSIIVSIISLSVNYTIYFIAVMITFIPSEILKINNDSINLILIAILYTYILTKLLKANKIKNGIVFLTKDYINEYFETLILNIGVDIIFLVIIISNINQLVLLQSFIQLVIVSIIMFITIKETFTMYYKHKLLVSDLEETKAELESKKKEIERLEAENLEFSKTSHTISHQIKSLKFKIKELEMSKEISNEIDISNRVQEISDEYYRKTAIVNIDKTDITEIDDMLNYMQSECINNDIEFELQLNGSIHYMVNNIIPKEKLEILLADHIKDAIIAVNHSDNINKSILVRLGLLDGVYSIYVYDSGIEFEEKTLAKLGKEPITTHKNEGGTGMGFMNTFDTLKKYNASMIINEIGKPSKDNYTKVIIIKFDNKNEFKIQSYKENIV